MLRALRLLLVFVLLGMLLRVRHLLRLLLLWMAPLLSVFRVALLMVALLALRDLVEQRFQKV